MILILKLKVSVFIVAEITFLDFFSLLKPISRIDKSFILCKTFDLNREDPILA